MLLITLLFLLNFNIMNILPGLYKGDFCEKEGQVFKEYIYVHAFYDDNRHFYHKCCHDLL